MPTVAEQLKKLTENVDKLEKSKLSLEGAVDLYCESIKLSNLLRETLELQASKMIVEVIRADGTTEPFDMEENLRKLP